MECTIPIVVQAMATLLSERRVLIYCLRQTQQGIIFGHQDGSPAWVNSFQEFVNLLPADRCFLAACPVFFQYQENGASQPVKDEKKTVTFFHLPEGGLQGLNPNERTYVQDHVMQNIGQNTMTIQSPAEITDFENLSLHLLRMLPNCQIVTVEKVGINKPRPVFCSK